MGGMRPNHNLEEDVATKNLILAILMAMLIGCATSDPVPHRVMLTNPQTGEWQYLYWTENTSPTWAGMAANSRTKAEFLYMIEAYRSKGFTDVREVK